MAELSRSLHTKEPAEARVRCLAATFWFRDTMRTMRQMPSPTREDLERAAADYFASLAEELDRPRPFDPDHFDQQITFNIESSRHRARELDDQLKTNLFDRSVQSRATEIVGSTGAKMTELPEREQLFLHQLAARAEREQMMLLIHMLKNPHRLYEPEDQLFGRRVLRTSRRPPADLAEDDAPSTVLREAVAIYLSRKATRGLSQSQINETARALMWLRERLGDLRPLSKVTKVELRKFRDDIARIDLTLRGTPGQFEDRLTNVADRQIKSVTALRYWRTVQSFFAWCAAEQYAPDDPSAGLKLEVRKGETKRSPLPFEADELKQLFKTPLYAGYKSRKRLREPGSCHVREGHWWSGVLLMFTGLRAGELSQFLPEDFVFDAEVPHLKVRSEDALGQRVKTTKNIASVRDVPLAPPLLELGLAEFVTGRAKVKQHARVFLEFRPGTQGRKSDGLSKFWAAYLRKFGLWKEGRATHVWRHTVIACLRANDVAAEDIAAFVGHSQGTVTEGYGGSYPLARKLKTAQRLDYGFDVVTALGGPYEKGKHQ